MKPMRGFGAIQLLPQIAMGIGSAGLIAAIVLLVLSSTQTQVRTIAGTNSAADNATTQAILGVSQVPNWLSVVAVAAVGSVVLLIIGALFMGYGGGGKKK